MRRKLMLVAVFGFALQTVGCTVPVFTHPLVPPDQATVPDGFMGEYQSVENGRTNSICIESAGEKFPAGFVRISMKESSSQPDDSTRKDVFLGFVKEMHGDLIFHYPGSKSKNQDEWATEWKPKEVNGYLIVKFKRVETGLEFSLLNGDFLIEEVKAGRLAGTYEPTERDANGKIKTAGKLEITASSEKLNQFFEQHLAGRIFSEKSVVLVRQKP